MEASCGGFLWRLAMEAGYGLKCLNCTGSLWSEGKGSSSALAAHRKALQRVLRTAEHILGSRLSTLQDTFHLRCPGKHEPANSLQTKAIRLTNRPPSYHLSGGTGVPGITPPNSNTLSSAPRPSGYTTDRLSSSHVDITS